MVACGFRGDFALGLDFGWALSLARFARDLFVGGGFLLGAALSLVCCAVALLRCVRLVRAWRWILALSLVLGPPPNVSGLDMSGREQASWSSASWR